MSFIDINYDIINKQERSTYVGIIYQIYLFMRRGIIKEAQIRNSNVGYWIDWDKVGSFNSISKQIITDRLRQFIEKGIFLKKYP